jgi:branched-chain amino acid transport system substrate-binding protein
MRRWLLLLLCTASSAFAQDAYVIGLSGALTGPNANVYAPVVEGIKLYIDTLNAKGGIGGRKVNLIIQDNSGEPSKAAADVKRFLTQDNVAMVINTSLSSTYAPMVAETKRAQVPLLFAGAVCPKEVYPPADELQFCTTAFTPGYDSRMALTIVKDMAKEPVRIGFAGMAIPISRAEMEYAAKLAKEMGMTPVETQISPPPAPDYTPFATKLKEANPHFVYSWSPWVSEVRTFEALRRIGWQGSYVTIAHIPAEEELPRLKDPGFIVYGANALFQDAQPGHRDIREAAKNARLTYSVEQMAEGWIGGMVIEQALKSAGWPATPQKLVAAMNNLKVDLKGLRDGGIEWTKDNHFRARQSYRAYRWDPAKNAIVRIRDWTEIK